MARLNIELSNEDLEALRRGERIEVQTIGDTPKIIISAEPEFDLKQNYLDELYPPSVNGLPCGNCEIEPFFDFQNDEIKYRHRKERMEEWQKGWYRDK